MLPLRRLLLFTTLLGALQDAAATNARTATPPMGWNSYNFYSCFATEDDIRANANALVTSGLATLGYVYVISDCGWSAMQRTSAGEITWNTTLYPSGFPLLGSFIHGLGLKFGIYSGAGTFQCHPDAGNGFHIQASLGHEQTDAATFAAWGGDYLKYDNCFADGVTFVSYVDPTPAVRFQTMAAALAAVDRPIVYGICQWGVGNDLVAWASQTGNSWRMSNDIFDAWSSIWRITNQVVPLAPFSKPGNFNDMDMLIVGSFGLTLEEQRTHMGIWAMEKSPLLIGAAVVDAVSLPAASWAILANPDVVAINQDALGLAAQLVRRFSQEQYDVWAGNLTGGRMILAVINWANNGNTITIDLPDAGVQRASTVRDVWAGTTLGALDSIYTATVPAHGMKLLVLRNITAAGLHTVGTFNAATSTTTFINVYARSSGSYALTATVGGTNTKSRAVTLTAGTITATAVVSGLSYALPLVGLPAGRLTVKIADPVGQVTSLQISSPAAHLNFYPAANAKLAGAARVQQCTTAGLSGCQPAGSKVINLNTTADTITFLNLSAFANGGSKIAVLHYVNFDLAFDSSWTGLGLGVLNATFSVNGGAAKQWSFPISGGDWEASGTMNVLLSGFVAGTANTVKVWSPGWRFGPHIVGLEVPP